MGIGHMDIGHMDVGHMDIRHMDIRHMDIGHGFFLPTPSERFNIPWRGGTRHRARGGRWIDRPGGWGYGRWIARKPIGPCIDHLY